MKSGRMYGTRAFFLVQVSVLLFIGLGGCKKKSAPEATFYTDSNDVIQLEVREVTEGEPVKDAHDTWHSDEGVICVLFGYGFNNEDFYTDALQKLGSEYGLEENDGLICALLYPDDFKGRISNLRSLIEEKTLRGLIILGAPEGTHNELARIQEDWDENVPYPVFSFFPRDDMLGQESTCNFVLEYARSVEDEALSTEIHQEIDETAENIVIRAVRYMAELPGPLPPDKDLHSHVQAIAGSTTIHRYTNRETGIQSINHFIMEQADSSQGEGTK